MFLSVDIGRFIPLDVFQSRMEKIVEEVKSTPPAYGFDEVLVAGDPENRSAAERRTGWKRRLRNEAVKRAVEK